MTTLTLDTLRANDVQEELRHVEPVDRDEHGDALQYEKFTTEEAWQRAEDQADLDARMRDKLARRAELAARARAIAYRTYRVVLWMILFACLLGLAATTLYVYKDRIVTDYNKLGMDTQPCISKVGERTITGTRTSMYRYMTVLGHKIFMTPNDEIERETRIDISGNGMTILGTKAGGGVEKTMISDGEKYRHLLKPADSYTFFMDGGKNTAVISYNELCK